MTEPAPWGTISVLTPPGRGAVAVLVFRGDLARLQAAANERGRVLFTSRSGFSLAELPPQRILLGHWGAEELVVCRNDEDSLEIHCHGGPAAIQRILHDVTTLGVSHSTAFTGQKLADISGEEFLKLPVLERPLVLEQQFQQHLARALTRQTARWIWRQQQLGQSFWLELASRLETLHSEDVGTVADRIGFAEQIKQAQQWSTFGHHLIEPWQVVIGGRPNVGKSSLINALLGYERAIVYDQPGTTRDVLTAQAAFAGWPVLLSDTAGQRIQAEPIEAAGIALAQQTLAAADLPLLLFDGSHPPEPDDLELLEQFPHALCVLNKADLNCLADWRTLCPQAVTISCRTGAGIDLLQSRLIAQLLPILPDESVVLPITRLHRDLLQACAN